MSEKTPFVINDRRKFTSEGDLRPDAPHSEHEREEPRPAAEPAAEAKAPIPFPSPAAESPSAEAAAAEVAAGLPDDEHLPPPPTAEQTEQANRAYSATVDR